MGWIRKHATTLVLTAILVVGVMLVAYPSVSNWYNTWIQRNAIGSYVQTVANMSSDRYSAIIEAAESYNDDIANNGLRWSLSGEDLEAYQNQLKVGDSTAMGYIEIPKIGEKLTIYHGTGDESLRTGVGHMDGTSLPIGGTTSHAVLTGHRGLPSAKLFSDLDKLVEGDTFVISVLDLTLTYAVDQIRTVHPDDLTQITLEPGMDYVTLVTCTPYGVNTHRLLVRGHRVENARDAARVVSEAVQIEPFLVIPFVAAPIVAVLLVIVLVRTRPGARGNHRGTVALRARARERERERGRLR